MRTFVLIIGLVATLGACSASVPRAGAAPRQCEPMQLDSRWTTRGAVYRPCEVGVVAKAIGAAPRLVYTPTNMGVGCRTALIEFVVDSTGTPESIGARIVRATDADLGEALLATVNGRRYTPATLGGRQVRQVVRESVSLVSRVVAVSSSLGAPASPTLNSSVRPVCPP